MKKKEDYSSVINHLSQTMFIFMLNACLLHLAKQCMAQSHMLQDI